MSSPEAPAGHGSRRPLSNLALRLLTAALVVPFLLYLLFGAPPWGLAALILVATAIAAAELASITGQRLPQRIWSIAAAVALGALLRWPPAHAAWLPTAIVALIVVPLALSLAVAEPIATAASRMAWSIVTPLYAGGLLATLSALHARPSGGAWATLALCLAWLGDTGGYFAGRAFGRRRLAPVISPSKTLEGLFGALAASTAGALVVTQLGLPEVPWSHALLLGILGSLCGIAGDLVESLVKRAAQVKDSGWIIPGHGGLLDRIDALLFTSATTWLYASWVHPV
ncbi:MAG: phosphatidate cytidylyltransferase [Myxococcota bacterium]|nr:phosphatidate cytidylyltransferase [Myxococcota bacterium]